MKKEIKVGIIVAVVEAILAFVVGYALYFVQADSLEQKAVETLAEYFDEIDEDMSYEQVMKFLYEDSHKKDEIIATLNHQNEELAEELTSLKEGITSDEATKEVINSAQTYANSSDYVMALAVLNSVTNKNDQMKVMIDDYQKKYEAQIIAEADSLVYQEKYNEATSLIDNALQVLQGSPTLEQKREAVLKSMPQTFMNVLHPYEVRGYSEKISGQFMEMGGTRYFNGFQLGTSWETSYAIFNLNAQYTQITGIIGHVDGSGEMDKTVNVFADGVLIATIDIGYQNLPQEFSFNIVGTRQLKFERTDGTTQTGFAELVIK